MESRTIKFIALDLDGTLLDSRHQLSPRSISVLKRLRASGVIIAIATGRSFAGVISTIKALEWEWDLPVVCYNGGYGFIVKGSDPSVKTTVFANLIPEDASRKLIEFALNHGGLPQFYNGESGEIYAVPKNDEHHRLLRRYADLEGIEQVQLTSYEDALKCGVDAAKLLVLTSESNIENLLAESQEFFRRRDSIASDVDPSRATLSTDSEQSPVDVLLSNSASITQLQKRTSLEMEFNIIRGSPDPFFAEYLRPDISKGVAVVQMCQFLNIQPQETVAFGDGDNDKEMLSFVGIGVAMSNAKAAARDAADLIIEWTNDEEGVARHLEKMEAGGAFVP